MVSDRSRVARGAGVSPATEEAATAIIARPPPTAVTEITSRTPAVPYAPPAAYYDYDEPRRRAVWPWFVALLFVAAAVVGGYFLYNQVQSQLSGSKTVAVDNYRDLREIAAVRKIRAKGLRWQVVRQYNAKVPVTYVFKQDAQPGERIAKGNYVTIFSSLGPPKTDIPSVVGDQLDAAVTDLQKASLNGRTV